MRVLRRGLFGQVFYRLLLLRCRRPRLVCAWHAGESAEFGAAVGNEFPEFLPRRAAVAVRAAGQPAAERPVTGHPLVGGRRSSRPRRRGRRQCILLLTSPP